MLSILVESKEKKRFFNLILLIFFEFQLQRCHHIPQDTEGWRISC